MYGKADGTLGGTFSRVVDSVRRPVTLTCFQTCALGLHAIWAR